MLIDRRSSRLCHSASFYSIPSLPLVGVRLPHLSYNVGRASWCWPSSPVEWHRAHCYLPETKSTNLGVSNAMNTMGKV